MDYKELNLKSGDLLTAAHMAHIEEGIDSVTAEVAKIKNAKIILRNDSSENWALVADTVILSKGEPAIEFDEENNAKLKIGDGIKTWAELSYVSTESADIEIPDNILDSFNELQTIVNSFDSRILNSESSAGAAASMAEEALTTVEELRDELNAAVEVQNEAILAAQTQINESITSVNEAVAVIEEVKNTQETQEMKIDAANARVDTLVAGFTDNAEFDNAELLDIRAGYDGVTYESAGAAVRQIGYDLRSLGSNLENALGKDIVDGLGYEGNKLYLTANGEMVGEPVTVIGGGGGGGNSN